MHMNFLKNANSMKAKCFRSSSRRAERNTKNVLERFKDGKPELERSMTN